MDKTDKLLFFDKEGYPFNFQYDNINKLWNGKIIFDENSDSLFKTIGLYIFEKVDSFDIFNVFDFEPSQLFNNSGITFASKTYENEIVDNIERVNQSSDFYTKIIYGDDFDLKFPKGTVISFDSGNTTTIWNYWDDFINTGFTYFCVLGTRKDAIIIETKTNNSLFNNFVFTTGITITSHNIIKFPDYGNQYLSFINNLNFYPDKKLNIVNSKFNDNIVTYRDYNILRNKVYDFDLSNEINGILNIELTLYTENLKLYKGLLDIEIIDNSETGTEITFFNTINSEIDFFKKGQRVTFNDYNGNNLLPLPTIFEITGYKEKELILTNDIIFVEKDNRYFIYIQDDINIYDLNRFDEILLKSNPIVNGETTHNDRRFEIISVNNEFTDDIIDNGVRIEVEQYVINESGYTYDIYKVFKKSEITKIYAKQVSSPILSPYKFLDNGVCYSISNKININQDILLSGNTEYYYENTINSINLKYKDYLDDFGIHLYHHHYNNKNYLIIEGIYEYNFNPYFNAIVHINQTPLSIGNNFTYTTTFTDSDVFYFKVDDQLINESVYLFEKDKLSRNFKSEILLNLNNDLINYGFKIILNGVDYYIKFNSNRETTINDWISKYSDIFDKLGFDVDIEQSTDGYSLIIDGKFPNVEVFSIDVFVNIYSDFSIKTQRNNGIVISSNQIRSIYTNLFDLGLSTGMIISLNNSRYPLNNKEYNIIRLDKDVIQLSYQGPFFYDYFGVDSPVSISVREFIRKPRSYYDKKIDYKASWVEPYVGSDNNNIFLYDFSGGQLKPYNDISSLTYKGIKPLIDVNSDKKVFLNNQANKFEEYVNDPSKQQTIFDNITYRLDMLNQSDSYNYIPVPMEFFIGFYSDIEGVSSRELKIEKIDYSYFSGITDNTINNNQFVISGDTINYITTDFNFDFNNYDFMVDQLIIINFTDINDSNQILYEDYKSYRIKDVINNKIIIDSIYSDELTYFNTIDLLTNNGKRFLYEIKTVPRDILRLKIYGQTEIEDERLDINLSNLGININKESELIFKDSDITEDNIDYIRLNRKRKEMLSMYPDIFNYVGSYKSLIRSIQFFGYNDLELYEYYKNIKPNSPLYGKLHKIILSDIFNNEIDGWDVDDFIESKYDKGYYKKTNLFNLTYRITDKQGNYSLQYSLDDVQIKLNSLVKWLRRNVIPLSSNILDITGVADTFNNIQMHHNSTNWVTKSVIEDISIAVNFYYTTTKITQDNYLLTINFYILDGCDKPDFYTVIIKTYSLNKENNELIPQYNNLLYKNDYEPYTINLNSTTDEFISIETTTFNGYGTGYSNSKMFKYDILKNYYLVNKNFDVSSFIYFNNDDGYYIIDDGRYYILK